MSRNWLRVVTLTADDGTDLLSGGLRLRFETVSSTNQTLSQANFIISNASTAKAAEMGELKKVTLSCGYQDTGPGIIFTGEITQWQYGEKERFTDPLLRIWAADGDSAYRQGRQSTTLAAGATPQDIVNNSLQALQPFGISMGQVVGVDLSQPQFPRGYVLSGLVRDHLREVALSKGATFNLNGGKLNIIAAGSPVPGAPVVLNSASGMIGQPIQQIGGIMVKCLINSAITVDSNVQIDQSSIVKTQFGDTSQQTSDATQQAALQDQGVTDGVYRVLKVKCNGDTRGNEYYMDLTCIGAFTGSVNQQQAAEGLQ